LQAECHANWLNHSYGKAEVDFHSGSSCSFRNDCWLEELDDSSSSENPKLKVTGVQCVVGSNWIELGRVEATNH
jgi:hypothetical protein